MNDFIVRNCFDNYYEVRNYFIVILRVLGAIIDSFILKNKFNSIISL